MQLQLDCLPCLHRQALEAARLASADEDTQAAVMDEAVGLLARRREFDSSPALAADLHRSVARLVGCDDPYAELKQSDVRLALAIEPALWSFVAAAEDQLLAALKVAATGNVMDSALNLDYDMTGHLDRDLDQQFARCEVDELRGELETARSVLVIADNAGEAVFDKVLLQALAAPGRRLTYATRGRPIINDVTLAEAHQAGVDTFATVISSGSPAPGTPLAACSTPFRELFETADIVISKGQGNIETLDPAPRPVYYLLRAKCALVARHLDAAVGDFLFLRR